MVRPAYSGWHDEFYWKLNGIVFIGYQENAIGAGAMVHLVFCFGDFVVGGVDFVCELRKKMLHAKAERRKVKRMARL